MSLTFRSFLKYINTRWTTSASLGATLKTHFRGGCVTWVPAAMAMTGIICFSAVGIIARVEPVELQPRIAHTFSCSISLEAAMLAFEGSLSSSSTRNSTGVPLMPPCFFNCCDRRFIERCSDWPSGAEGPDSESMTPILNLSCFAVLPQPATSAPATTSAIAMTVTRDLLLDMSGFLLERSHGADALESGQTSCQI